MAALPLEFVQGLKHEYGATVWCIRRKVFIDDDGRALWTGKNNRIEEKESTVFFLLIIFWWKCALTGKIVANRDVAVDDDDGGGGGDGDDDEKEEIDVFISVLTNVLR